MSDSFVNDNSADSSEKYSRIRRYKFSDAEDQRLSQLVSIYGTRSWGTIASMMQGRSSRQCRDRWNHYLSPSANNEEWTDDEDLVIINQLKLVGKQWTYISSLLAGRTSIAVRNRACKLSRRKDADPMVKNLLKDEYKKKSQRDDNSDQPYSPVKTPEENKKQFQLPSCNDLLKMARVDISYLLNSDRKSMPFPLICSV